MQVHFISDLHLSADRPALTGVLERYLAGPARRAGQLYILGDLFEHWAGDDDFEDPLNSALATRLAEVAGAGTELFFMAGNRDFLLGQAFASRAGLKLLSEPTLIKLGEAPTLLCHGDALCTDDVAYQAFRSQVRHPAYQAQFLAQPLAARKQFIAGVRMKSEQAKSGKAASIMDVNDQAVAALLREHGYPRLIHGHTHRPNLHYHRVDAHDCERWVLSDWRDNPTVRGEVLVWDDGELTRQPLE
ncbi:UDP-2,3-diacylglucosamine diphosphatase [Zoogloea sp.]|uniref:UDP-2,3-diacylglucosamine diphosphatase n=1 Tax=Zoogloea sp. TaxID=49181 RepID=UPI002627C3EF|nr:UDP-2,3-diacylglucosamine diphosphatase [Zoogloea sp.]MDD3353226.1 UDP-2,3-diacylglucosamine diphosphatase [Zoogloea sp.]